MSRSLTVRAAGIDLDFFEGLAAEALRANELRIFDSTPEGGAFKSDLASSIVLAIIAAGGVKAFSRIVVAYIEAGRGKLTLIDHSSGVSMTLEGPLRSKGRVEGIVEAFAAAESLERTQPAADAQHAGGHRLTPDIALGD